MLGEIFQSVRAMTTATGWSAIVESMESAFSDPKHVIILGIAFVIAVVIFINYRVAKWLEHQAEHYHEHHEHEKHTKAEHR